MGHRWKGATIEWVIIWVRKDLNYSSEVLKIYLIVLKVVACLACWCRGKTFPSRGKYCPTTLMTFKIPYTTWAVGSLFNLYVGLQAAGWLHVLGMPLGGDLRLWMPGARGTDLGQRPNLCVGSWRAPCVPRSPEHDERPAAGREKELRRAKRHISMYSYNVPLRDVCDMKSRRWRKLMKRDTKVTQQQLQVVYVGGNMEYLFHEE